MTKFTYFLTLKHFIAECWIVLCISILLYGSVSWIPFRRHIRMLEAFHIRCLQSILGIRWWHRKTHIETHNTANIESIEHLVLQRQLHWLGHVIHMPSNQLSRCLLYSELLIGQRPVGRPKLRFSDHIKSVLRKCDISEADLEQFAADMDSWRSTCATGLESFAAASVQVASDRRARWHATAQAVRVRPACTQCGKVCTSDFGLCSRLRMHQRPQWHYH